MICILYLCIEQFNKNLVVERFHNFCTEVARIVKGKNITKGVNWENLQMDSVIINDGSSLSLTNHHRVETERLFCEFKEREWRLKSSTDDLINVALSGKYSQGMPCLAKYFFFFPEYIYTLLVYRVFTLCWSFSFF